MAEGAKAPFTTPAQGDAWISTHGEGCDCTRCVGFQPGNEHVFKPGNDLSLKHGGYASPVRFSDEIEKISEILVNYVPMFREADSLVVQQLALALIQTCRLEPMVAAAQEEGDFDKAYKISQLLRGWSGTVAKRLDEVGMNPTARARLGVDVAAVIRAKSLTDLHAEAAKEDALEGDAEEAPAAELSAESVVA